ncbi:MAG TPA: 50S ribosomal protein L18e [Candidatus Thermoplasmatota archaeon]
MARPGPKSNDELVALLGSLRKASRAQGAPIWADVARRLQGPSKTWAEVNVSRLARVAPEGATVLVPGKVLGSGALTHAVTVAAFQFSSSARDKIRAAGGHPISIAELMRKSPKGSGVRIVA